MSSRLRVQSVGLGSEPTAGLSKEKQNLHSVSVAIEGSQYGVVVGWLVTIEVAGY